MSICKIKKTIGWTLILSALFGLGCLINTQDHGWEGLIFCVVGYLGLVGFVMLLQWLFTCDN